MLNKTHLQYCYEQDALRDGLWLPLCQTRMEGKQNSSQIKPCRMDALDIRLFAIAISNGSIWLYLIRCSGLLSITLSIFLCFKVCFTLTKYVPSEIKAQFSFKKKFMKSYYAKFDSMCVRINQVLATYILTQN